MRAFPPALGERRAAAGFWPQFRVQAVLAYRELARGLLEEVRIADPEAGRVDDFQVLTPERLDAYQVKWSSYVGSFTFKDLVADTAQHPALIAQLADGWCRLREANPQRRVVVHLITNNHPSRDDKPAKGALPGLPSHFAAFLKEVWNPWMRGLNPQVADHWQEARHRIIEASGLADADFWEFVRACELDFDFRLPVRKDDPSGIDQRSALEVTNDLNALAAAFFELTADPRRIVQIPLRDLLKKLGWEQRFRLRHRHEFPEPDLLYKPIGASVQALEEALSKLSGGYILLLGSPGSGKSTLLTQVLRYRPERVVRYYAFVRDEVLGSRYRGEAKSFLHDLTLELDRQGIRAEYRLPSTDLELLSKHLQVQLQQLHTQWVETGRKTIILVDGLDHIAREQSPDRSLLRDLPEPLPDGVYFLLGSQTDLLPELPTYVKAQISQPERQLRMQPLSRESVFEILAEAKLSPIPTFAEREDIFRLSDGHPLALSYIVNRFHQHPGSSVAEILASVKPFNETIDNQYLAHWQQISGDFELVHLLALLVRINGALDLSWVRRWARPPALYRLLTAFSHYFRQEQEERWFFFHNSFRVFLLQKTRDPALGPEENFYRELADVSAAESLSLPWSWGEIYYRLKAGENDRALDLANIEKFRQQFYHGRPWSSIREDIKSLLPLTIHSRDVATLARLLFCGIEIGERGFNAEEYADLPLLLLQLRDWKPALEWLNQEVPDEEDVIRAEEISKHLRRAQELVKAGYRDEGKRLFERVEPLSLLTGRHKIQHAGNRTTQELLTAWVEAAYLFRPLDQIIDRIGKLQHERDSHERRDSAEEDKYLHNDLYFTVARCLANAERWEELFDILKRWEGDWFYWFWGHLRSAETAFQKGEKERARDLLGPAMGRPDLWPKESEARVYLANAVFQIMEDQDAASSILLGVKIPPLSDPRSRVHIYEDDLNVIFWYYRLLSARSVILRSPWLRLHIVAISC